MFSFIQMRNILVEALDSKVRAKTIQLNETLHKLNQSFGNVCFHICKSSHSAFSLQLKQIWPKELPLNL